MDRETRNFAVAIGIIAVIVVGGYAALVAYTGSTLPFSIVVSSSMQHDNDRSEIGVIDTGDIVVVADPDKVEIRSYVAGYDSGYSSFGEYGSVIIYDRGSGNPVIHRAIVWIDYDESTGTWYSDELAETSVNWYCLLSDGVTRSTDASNLRGTLFIEIGGIYTGINLDNVAVKGSGYLTKGDNSVTNSRFDQDSGIVSYLISEDKIVSVAVAEIPWLGIIKLVMNGSSYVDRVPNSLPSLLMAIVLVFSVIVLIDAVSLFRYTKEKTECIESRLKWRRG
ncbi:MAG: S26 family signal peptidase [Thermoplasmata archaeon]|nr:S26 family signal peptidase [Thermoplasmata archaeon]